MTTDAPVTQRRYPTRINVRCMRCHHRGQVRVYLDRPLVLRCTRCSARNATVVERDRIQAWAGQRRGK
jgi:hypothetical protein